LAHEEKLVLQVRAFLWERGRESLELAKKTILQERTQFQPLQEALQYFIVNWEDVLHPALMALACEAVGGKPEKTTRVAAALVLLAGGADVHDDVIDQSTIKDSKPTVFGKYGKDLAILVGDALLFKGLYLLHESCEAFPENRKHAILELMRWAFFGISSAEAKEASLRGKTDPSIAAEYLNMIRLKAAVGEATTKIGAIVGGGSEEQIEMLGNYGKTLAVLYAIRDEFIDTYELDELRNRIENECLPLPILFALKDSKKASGILRLLKKDTIAKEDGELLLDLVMDSKEVEKLKKEMETMINEQNHELLSVEINEKIFALLIQSMMEDL
jgi:geranylgeranyl diphosphate synthase type I